VGVGTTGYRCPKRAVTQTALRTGAIHSWRTLMVICSFPEEAAARLYPRIDPPIQPPAYCLDDA
jgi:hypothetical protein